MNLPVLVPRLCLLPLKHITRWYVKNLLAVGVRFKKSTTRTHAPPPPNISSQNFVSGEPFNKNETKCINFHAEVCENEI